MQESKEITQWLIELKNGSEEAYDKLFPLVYDQLRLIAYHQITNEPDDHTWSKTDLVHEVYLKLIDQNGVDWKDCAHFYGIAARSMRQILIDYARKKTSQKRGGDLEKVTFIDEIIKARNQAEELIEIDERRL